MEVQAAQVSVGSTPWGVTEDEKCSNEAGPAIIQPAQYRHPAKSPWEG